MPSDPKRIDRFDAEHQPRHKQDASQADGSAVAHNTPPMFQPRLILPEPAPLDDQGDLDLPEELTALAEQLQDDAAHLAHCYAPETTYSSIAAPGATAGSSSSARRRFALLTTAAATIALALSFALLAIRDSDQDKADRPVAPAAATNQPTDTRLDSLAQDQLGQLDQSESLLLLGEASGPEREGLLDLLQQTANTETSISF